MSLRLRLTLWYTAILALTLLLVSVLVYTVLSFSLNQQVNQFLDLRAQQYSRALLLAGSDRGGPLSDLVANFNPDTYAQLVTIDGRPISHTSNLPPSWPLDPALIRRAVQNGVTIPQTVQAGDVVLRIDNIPLSVNGQTRFVLQLGRDVTQTEASLRFLREILFLGSALGILVAFAAGWLVARQALKPIERIAQTAEDIGDSRDFSRRVQYSGPNDELGRLSSTFNEMLSHIQAAYAQIESALAAQRRFVADASHELRTPLTTIRGNLGLLARSPQVTSEDRHEAVEDMASEAERMSRLVSNLLVLARADAGLHVEKEPIRVDEIVKDVYRQARILSKGVALVVNAEPAIVNGSPDYLKQLLLILVDNALKNTPPGGRVEMKMGFRDGSVLLSVADTGKGIPSESLPHIFERFYQADKSRTGGGTGLGLSIAKWIVEEHGGDIAVQSTVGTGSVFTIRLPGKPAPAVEKDGAEDLPATAETVAGPALG